MIWSFFQKQIFQKCLYTSKNVFPKVKLQNIPNTHIEFLEVLLLNFVFMGHLFLEDDNHKVSF